MIDNRVQFSVGFSVRFINGPEVFYDNFSVEISNLYDKDLIDVIASITELKKRINGNR